MCCARLRSYIFLTLQIEAVTAVTAHFPHFYCTRFWRGNCQVLLALLALLDLLALLEVSNDNSHADIDCGVFLIPKEGFYCNIDCRVFLILKKGFYCNIDCRVFLILKEGFYCNIDCKVFLILKEGFYGNNNVVNSRMSTKHDQAVKGKIFV